MINNVKELRKATRHDWIEQLDDLKAVPIIMIAITEENNMVILNKEDNPYTAVGYLEEAKNIILMGDEV